MTDRLLPDDPRDKIHLIYTPNMGTQWRAPGDGADVLNVVNAARAILRQEQHLQTRRLLLDAEKQLQLAELATWADEHLDLRDKTELALDNPHGSADETDAGRVLEMLKRVKGRYVHNTRKSIETLGDLCGYFGVDEPHEIFRRLYKGTECGAWIQFRVPHSGNWITNGSDPQIKHLLRRTDRLTELQIGSIVEGSDAEVAADVIPCPCAPRDIEQAIRYVEETADQLWHEANDDNERED